MSHFTTSSTALAGGATTNRTCYYCGKKGHDKAECRKKAAINKLPMLARTACTIHKDSVAWVLDSGATQHMTGNRDLLSNVTALREDVYVRYLWQQRQGEGERHRQGHHPNVGAP
jgi:hypothetical protein